MNFFTRKHLHKPYKYAGANTLGPLSAYHTMTKKLTDLKIVAKTLPSRVDRDHFNTQIQTLQERVNLINQPGIKKSDIQNSIKALEQKLLDTSTETSHILSMTVK